MSRESLRIIHDEHDALSAMLRSIGMMVDRGAGNDPENFFDVLRAMLFYIDEFPERLHHTKESELLFPPVARLAPETRETIEKLEKDHQHGESAVRELQHLLLAWELIGDSRRAAFEAAAKRYLAFYLEHMRLEETVILPVAQKVLSADALDDHRDALAHADAHGAQRVAAAGACSWFTAVVASRAPLAPSGWPSAMAPPLGLTRGSSSARPRSRSTARPCAAKASLSSMTSICASVRPVSSSTLRVAGAGPMPMTRGATPAVAMPTTRARGVRPWRAARGLAGQQQRAGAVVHAAGIAGGHRAVGPHHALELGQRLQAGLARVLVAADLHRVALLLRMLTG
jgi:hemerythrin-like domain-containing protein